MSNHSDQTFLNGYLCVPYLSWFNFTWFSNGIREELRSRCLQWKIPGSNSTVLNDKYLCAQEEIDGKGNDCVYLGS